MYMGSSSRRVKLPREPGGLKRGRPFCAAPARQQAMDTPAAGLRISLGIFFVDFGGFEGILGIWGFRGLGFGFMVAVEIGMMRVRKEV